MLKLNDEVLATLAATKALLDADQAIQRKLVERVAARRGVLEALKREREIVAQCEVTLSRSDDPPINTAARLATARTEGLRLEQELGEIDRDVADLAETRKASRPEIERASIKFAETESALRAFITRDLQGMLEPLARELAKVLMLGLAVSQGLNGQYRQALVDTTIPALDRRDRPLLANARLRTALEPELTVVQLEQLWRDDVELVKLSELLADFTRTARSVKEQGERVARERFEEIHADPQAKATFEAERREKRRAEDAARKKEFGEAREKSQREEEDRLAQIVDARRSGKIGGTADPGDLGTKELAERRARIAAEAKRAEAALNARVSADEANAREVAA
ncbi:MAG: hypothetical protein KBA31_00165 [Alphaproteobacteria bacterium]|nr:hypothetical protein [Alphaproteobacteria bacterium]